MYFDQMREKSEDLNRFKNRKKKKEHQKRKCNMELKLEIG